MPSAAVAGEVADLIRLVGSAQNKQELANSLVDMAVAAEEAMAEVTKARVAFVEERTRHEDAVRAFEAEKEANMPLSAKREKAISEGEKALAEAKASYQSAYDNFIDMRDKKNAELAAREEEVSKRELAATNREGDLSQREARVAAAEAQLQVKETELNDRAERLRAALV